MSDLPWTSAIERDLPYLPSSVPLSLAGEEEFTAIGRDPGVGGGEKLWRQGGDHGGCCAFGSEAQAHKAAAERKASRGIARCEFGRLDEGDVWVTLERAGDDGCGGLLGALREGSYLAQNA
jgi:hypothetical protein